MKRWSGFFLSRAGNDKIDDSKHDFVNLLGGSKIGRRKELGRNHLDPDFAALAANLLSVVGALAEDPKAMFKEMSD